MQACALASMCVQHVDSIKEQPRSNQHKPYIHNYLCYDDNRPFSFCIQVTMGDEIRVRYHYTWLGTISDFLNDNAGVAEEYAQMVDQLANLLTQLEKSGAAPVLPDGKISGNGAAKLRCGSRPYMVVSKSGRLLGLVQPQSDFCVIQSFDSEHWQCNYRSSRRVIRRCTTRPSSPTVCSDGRPAPW